MIADFNRSPTIHVRRDHGGPGPIQIPSVFDGQNGVRTWDNIQQIEGTVEVALIAAEKIAVALRIFGDQNHHRSGERLAGALRRALYVQAAAHHGERNGGRGTRGHDQGVT